jgi:signal transduction histidine kinase
MSPLWKLVTRVRAIDPLRLDVVVALLAGAALVVEALESEYAAGHRTTAVVAGLLMVVPALALRRRAPVLASAVLMAVLIVQTTFGSDVLGELAVPFMAMLALFYSVGRYCAGHRFWAGFTILAGGLAALLVSELESASDLPFVALLVALPTLAGRAVRSRVLLQRELRVKALRVEAGREQRAREAVEDERGRIAEELQTVIANGLSAMVVQAGAVPRVLAARDEAGARQAFLVIEETGRDALAEMRRLLGVLRHDDEVAELAPQPGLARLDSLLERMRQSGLEVSLTVDGADRELPTGVDLTAYRLVQQSVESAMEAGAVTSSVTLRYAAHRIEIDVSDDRAGDDAAALAGMRERVRLYGGRLSTGASNGAGFRVQAWLPLDEKAPR